MAPWLPWLPTNSLMVAPGPLPASRSSTHGPA